MFDPLGHVPELAIALLIAVLVFGPKRLPELGRGLGEGIRAFRKATSAPGRPDAQEKEH
ncbi:MAG: twin-arginine translocase TatA/TatE family subunit [Chloroflexota bacterium]